MDTFFQLGPRENGVREQLDRAVWFLQLGNSCPDVRGRFRLHLAGVYAARAIAELMLEAAWNQELPAFRNDNPKQSRVAFEDAHLVSIAHYHLIEKVRIHDFHRSGCVPPDPRYKMQIFGGPMKLIARQGGVVVQVTPEGPQVTTTGQSVFKEQRALLQEDDCFFDDVTAEFLTLEQILPPYLEQIRPVISAFEKLIRPASISEVDQ